MLSQNVIPTRASANGQKQGRCWQELAPNAKWKLRALATERLQAQWLPRFNQDHRSIISRRCLIIHLIIMNIDRLDFTVYMQLEELG